MPRSTIANRREYLFDKALELRSYTAAALSATGSGTAIALDAAKLEEFRAIVQVAAYADYAAGTAQWSIAVQASVDNSTFTTIESVVPPGTAQEYRIPLSGEWVDKLASGAVYIRVTATKTGAAGNLTYGAFLTTGSANK